MQYDIILEQLRALLTEKRTDEIKELLGNLDPADVADLIESLNEDDQDYIFDMLEPEVASEVVAELEPGSLDDVVEGKSPEEMALLLTNMAPDDAVDFLEELELSREQQLELLALLPDEDRRELSELLRYEEDSGGSIMTPELCALPANATVQDAIKAIGEAELSDPIMHVFVVEPNSNVLLGFVYLTDIMTSASKAAPEERVTLAQLVQDNYVWASTDEDQEEIARNFRKYNLWVMPVVDEKHRLVGRITADDIMDVMQEEADEDMAHMVGVGDFEEADESPWKAAKMRLPWLLITMVAGLLNSMLIDNIQKATAVATVAIFIPVLMAMGGNTSMQSTAITVREIALGRNQTKLLQTIWKQVLIGSSMGIVSAGIVWGGAWLVLKTADLPIGVSSLSLASAIAISMFIAMVFASSFGAIVPVVLNKLNIDPAVASGPFVTTSNDLSASLIYFGSCLLIL